MTEGDEGLTPISTSKKLKGALPKRAYIYIWDESFIFYERISAFVDGCHPPDDRLTRMTALGRCRPNRPSGSTG